MSQKKIKQLRRAQSESAHEGGRVNLSEPFFDAPQERAREHWDAFKASIFECAPPVVGKFMSWGRHGVMVYPNLVGRNSSILVTINPPVCADPGTCSDENCVERYIWEHLRERTGVMPNDPSSLCIVTNDVATLRALIDFCDRAWHTRAPKLFGPLDNTVMVGTTPVGNA